MVAEHVNADLKTTKQHYDKATEEEKRKRRRKRMERDRRPFIDDVDLGDIDPDADPAGEGANLGVDEIALETVNEGDSNPDQNTNK